MADSYRDELLNDDRFENGGSQADSDDADRKEDLLDDELSDGDDETRIPIEMLASDFLDRRRQGERITIDDFVAQHPELESEIRELFPAMLAMENIRDDADSASGAQPARSTVPVPERLGDLRIIRQIGRGGMGIVYEAEQESLGRRVAVKVLPQMGLGEDRRVQRFHREASAAAKLHHTNIVPVLGVGQHEGHHYYVMQLIRGVGLDEIIVRYARRDAHSPLNHSQMDGALSRSRAGQISKTQSASSPHAKSNSVADMAAEVAADVAASTDALKRDLVNTDVQVNAGSDSGSARTFEIDRHTLTDRVVDALEKHCEHAQSVSYPIKLSGQFWNIVARIGLQAAEALAYAHDMNTLHRDIKPANLIVDEHGIVWVTDFGLAKVLDDSDHSHTGDLAGTLRYMPPERFSGESDHRSDIHALGLTLYELIAGRPAFDETDRAQLIRNISQGAPPPLRRLKKNVPRDLETIVSRSIERDPGRRYQSAVDLADDLRRFLDDLPIRARKIGALERSWRWCRRNPALATLTTSTVVLFLAVLAMSIAGYFRSNTLLAREQMQRQLADQTNQVAVETLDSLYSEFAPRRVQMLESRSLIDADGSEITVDLPPVISDESARMLERFLPLYDRLALLDEGQNDKYQLKSIEANRRIGDIRHQLGQYELSLTAYKTANQKLLSLISAQPSNTSLQLRLASLQNEMGLTTRSESEFGEWRSHHEHAIEVLSNLEEDLSGDEGSLIKQRIAYERARAYYYLGKLSVPLFVSNPLWLFRDFGASRFPGASSGGEPREFDPDRWRERINGGFRGRPPRRSNDPDRTPDDGPTSGEQQENSSGESGARPSASADLENRSETNSVIAELVRESALRPRYRLTGYQAQGVVQTRSGQDSREQSTQSREQGNRRTGDESAEQGNENRSTRSGDRNSRSRGGGFLGGDLEWMNLAVEEAQKLHEAYPASVEYEFFLASCYRERALLVRDGHGSVQDLNRATEILQHLVERYPEIPDYRFELSRTLAMEPSSLGIANSSEDTTRLNEAIDHTIQLSRQHPNVLAYADFLGLLYIRQAQEYVLSGGKERVDELLWLAVEQYILLMERAPNSWFYRFAFENAVLNWLAVVAPRVEFAARYARDQNPDQRPEWTEESAIAFEKRKRDRAGSVDLQEDILRLLELREVVEGYDPGTLTWQVKSGVYQSLVWAYQKSDQAESAAPYQAELEVIREQLRESAWDSNRPRFGPPPSNRRGGGE